MTNLTTPLPEGWESEELPGWPDVLVLTRPGHHIGFVSIDMKRRIFATGCGSPRTPAFAGMTYKGRDWQARIVADAVKWLDDVMA